MQGTTKKKARIAVVMPKLGRYGGAEGFAWRLAAALAEKGHDVDFICARVEEETPSGVRPVVVGRFGPFRFIKVLWFALAAEYVQRRNTYDLVFGLGNTVTQDIARVGGCPIRVFNRLSIRAWPKGFARFFKAFRRAVSPAGWTIAAIDSLRMKRAGTVVAVSDFVRERILEAHPYLEAQRVRVIYNEPDISRFVPATDQERQHCRGALGIGPNDVVVATAGTNFMLKGIGPLLRALALLPQEFRLHVAGGRNPAAFLRLARTLGVEERVRFHGRVSDMVSFYRAADVFVLASFFDACSNAVLEAQACGCRVLSSAMNGSARFVDTKYVFPDPADHANMAKLIQRVFREPVAAPPDWPDAIDSGLGPYLDLVDHHLNNRRPV